MNNVESSNNFNLMLSNVIKIPGIKVNRKEFLISEYSKYIDEKDIPNLLSKGPVAIGIDQKTIDKMAKKLIDKRTLFSSGASFMAGLPGGFTMAAAIPADVMQFFAVSIRLAQELSYIYGFDDIWEGDDEEIRNQLTLYLGSMFGVSGANEAIRVVSSKLSNQVLKKLPQQALTKGFIYPIIKNIAKFLGIKMTKDIFAKGVSKAIPIVGGIISGGITFASMKPMGNRLKETLSKSTFSYTESDYNKDIDTLSEAINATDVEFTPINSINEEFNQSTYKNKDTISNDNYNSTESTTSGNTSKSFVEKLKEAKELFDLEIIDENEYKSIKEKLLANNFNYN